MIKNLDGFRFLCDDFKIYFDKILNQSKKNPVAIITPNPEIYLESLFNVKFKKLLPIFDYALMDGFGLALMYRFFGSKIPRQTGVDFTDFVLKSDLNVFVVGSDESSLNKIKIKNYYTGIISSNVYVEILKKIKICKPDIILVALGNPKQDFLIDYLKKKLNQGVLIGVGGSIDYLSGSFKRPPRYVRSFGFEWLYRLIKQPQRFVRIFKAVVVFPIVFLIRKLFLF